MKNNITSTIAYNLVDIYNSFLIRKSLESKMAVIGKDPNKFWIGDFMVTVTHNPRVRDWPDEGD